MEESSGVIFSEVKEEMEELIEKTIEKYLKDKGFSTSGVSEWANGITEECVERLQEISKGFKYIVSCVIMQKADAGLHLTTTCFWNSYTDGSLTVRWHSSQIYCIVNTFIIAI